MAYTEALTGANVLTDLASLDTTYGTKKILGKKGAQYIDDAIAGTFTGKGTNKAIDACEEAVTLSKKVLEGSVPVSELGAGKTWWGKVKASMFGDVVSTEKLKELAKELQELKADQAAGITGLDAKIAKKSEKFLEEAQKVLPTLPHFQQSATKALAAVEQQEKRAVTAAQKGLEAWAKKEKAAKVGTIQTDLLAADIAAHPGADGKFHKWDSGTSAHVVDTSKTKALEKAAEKEWGKVHKKDFRDLYKEREKDIIKEIEGQYKGKKKDFKRISKQAEKTIAGIEEETGLKATEMVSTKGKETLAAAGNKEAAAALKAEKNFLGGSISGNLKKGLWSKGKVAVGAVGVFDGVRRVWKGFSPGQDEQGNPKAMDPFQIAIGAGETALGAFVAGHGGHIK